MILTYLVPVLFKFYIQGVLKLKKNNSGAKRLKERRGYSYLNEGALDRTIWRDRFGRDFGPVVRQTNKRVNLLLLSVVN